jgi:hypothetical protein
VFGEAFAYVPGLCAPGDPLPASPVPMLRIADNTPLRGLGLMEPGR